ncbi:uncharacterized protein LOC117444998 [Tachysurus ichikawai]
MAERYERMRQKCGTIRASTTKLLSHIEEESNRDGTNCEKLHELLSLLSTKEESLSELEKGIEEATPTDELEDEVDMVQEYQDHIVLWKRRATRLIQGSRDSTACQSDVSAVCNRQSVYRSPSDPTQLDQVTDYLDSTEEKPLPHAPVADVLTKEIQSGAAPIEPRPPAGTCGAETKISRCACCPKVKKGP